MLAADASFVVLEGLALSRMQKLGPPTKKSRELLSFLFGQPRLVPQYLSLPFTLSHHEAIPITQHDATR
jgi:hypothetical protein